MKKLLILMGITLLVSTGLFADWGNEQKVTASDIATGDYYGISVSVSGDYALIGAYADDDNGIDSGSAYIYYYNGTFWTEQQKLTASDGVAQDWFGYSVSISGDYALIGSRHNNGYSGSAYIFHYNGTSWVEQQKLNASDSAGGDFFGNSVSIAGDYALIGSYRDDDNGYDSGSAYIYYYDGISWIEQQKLNASDGDDDDRFGNSVSISGDYALVGVSHGYNISSILTGSAYIFHYDGTSWAEQQKLNPSDGQHADWFGTSVSIAGDYALIGAVNDDDNGDDSGSAYLYYYDGTSWAEQQKLTASDGDVDDSFGVSVSLYGDYALIGAHEDDVNGNDFGSAYLYSYDGAIWTEQQKFTASDGSDNDKFGISVCISGDNAVVGSYMDGGSYGSAYFYGNEDPAPVEDIYISEISDNLLGQNESTGFIEILNNSGVPLSLNGYSIVQGTNPGEAGFIPGAYSYPIPAGYTIPNQGYFTVANGASLSTFNTAWSSALGGTEFDAGNSSLVITNGYAYALSDGARANKDESPEVNVGERIHQESGGSWPQDTPNDATPGEQGGDGPLPVTLSSFTASFSNGTSMLSWTTQSESNNLGWNVYRSGSEEIAEGLQINNEMIEGAGTTTEQTDYTFADQHETASNTSYWYWIESVDQGGSTNLHGPVRVDIYDEDDDELPPELISDYGLAQNYPNPFNPSTKIAFKLSEQDIENAKLKIYNPKGQIVKTFDNLSAGNSELGSVTWDGTDDNGHAVSSGIYMYKLKTTNKEYTKKMIMMK